MEISALDALLASSRAFDAGSTLDELLDEVVTQAQRLVDADRCALLLYDPATEVFSVERTCGNGTRISDSEGMSAAVVLDLAVRAARDLCPFRTNDLTSDPGRLEVSPGMRSTIVVPLIAGNEVAAVIIAESARDDAFSELHEKLLSVSGTPPSPSSPSANVNASRRESNTSAHSTRLASSPASASVKGSKRYSRRHWRSLATSSLSDTRRSC